MTERVRAYAYFLSNVPAHWRQWGETLPKFSQVECQFEFLRTVANAAGERFTPTGQTPAAWLRERGREPWLYVNARWPWPNAKYGAPGAAAEGNPYWFRQMQTDAIARNGWWLMGLDRAGNRSAVEGKRGYAAADMANHEYLAWLLEHLLAEAPKRIRFDESWIHGWGYYLPWLVGSSIDASDITQAAASFWLYDELRAAGVQVMANGAWEMNHPESAPWQFLAMEHLDGAMIEWPTGFRRWDSGKWWSLTEAALMGVAAAWKAAGREIVLVPPYEVEGEKKSPYPSWEAHAQHWIGVAKQLGVYLAMGRDDGDWSASSQTWWRSEYEDGGQGTEDGPAPKSLAERVVELEEKVENLRLKVEEMSHATG